MQQSEIPQVIQQIESEQQQHQQLELEQQAALGADDDLLSDTEWAAGHEAAGHEIRGSCIFCGKPVMQFHARYKGPAGYCHVQCFNRANQAKP